MSIGARRPHLLAYDIRERKRLLRVHRCMRKHAVPVQYSVFIGHWNARELRAVLDELDDIIEPVDDVRAYALPQRSQPCMLGPPLLPEGVLLEGADLLLQGGIGVTRHDADTIAPVAWATNGEEPALKPKAAQQEHPRGT